MSNLNDQRGSWRTQIDQELGAAKWSQELEIRIEQQTKKRSFVLPAVYVAFIAVALFLLMVSLAPEKHEMTANLTEVESIDKIYVRSDSTFENGFKAKPSKLYVGVHKITEPASLALLEQILPQLKPIAAVPDVYYEIQDIVVIADGKQWDMKVFSTDDHMLYIREMATSTFYEVQLTEAQYEQYEQGITQDHLSMLLGYVLGVLVIVLILEYALPYVYGVKRRKNYFDPVQYKWLNKLVNVFMVIGVVWMSLIFNIESDTKGPDHLLIVFGPSFLVLIAINIMKYKLETERIYVKIEVLKLVNLIVLIIIGFLFFK